MDTPRKFNYHCAMETLSELIGLLTLEQLDDRTFKGENYQAPWGRVFGGQVLAQGLHAAYRTVPSERIAHSLHGYFILGGQLDLPIIYEVDLVRNGGSFTTRRVVARQEGRAIFTMAASFQIIEPGVEHQLPFPEVLAPEGLLTSLEQMEAVRESHPAIYKRLRMTLPREFEFRPLENIIDKLSHNSAAMNGLWMRSLGQGKLPLPLQQQLLAYVSDYNLLITATLPHRDILNRGKTFYASLDHAIWFHREFDMDAWLLYTMDSPSASNSRGFTRGSIYDREGRLVASVAQEGLMRQPK